MKLPCCISESPSSMHCVEGVAPHEQRINVEAMISAGQKLIIFSPNDAVEKLLKSFYH